MTKTSLLPVLAIAAFAQSPAKTPPSSDLMTGRDILNSGVAVSFRINYEPWPPSNGAFNTALTGIDPAGGNAMRHYICDTGAGSCLGIEMRVSGPPSNMRVSFRAIPMSHTLRENLDASAHGRRLNFVELRKYPPAQTVRVGDTLAIDLMTSADGKDKLVEYFKFSAAPDSRDASIDDASFFSLDFRAVAEVRVDRQTIMKAADFSIAHDGGSTVWLYVPGEGRYILSLSPHDGFSQAGRLRGGSAWFHSGAHDYEIRGLLYPGLLSGTDSMLNLYIFRDPTWLPATSADSIIGGIDRLTNLKPER